jgi:predicted transcriptional regulator of viral defense system
VDARSLSKTQARVILSLEAEGLEVVTLDGIRQRARISPGFARKLAHDLVGRGWLQPLRRGTYLLNPSHHGPDSLPDADPLRIGSHLVEPYYFGFATAAELHGLLPQASQLYYVVTPTRILLGKRTSGWFRLVRILPRHFFGWRTLVRRRVQLRVSDWERTLLDCLYRPELCGGPAGVAQVFAQAKPKLDWARLGTYLDRFGLRSLTLRAGFLAEQVRPSLPPPDAWVRARLPGSGEPFVPLGPPKTFGRKGERDPRWHIIQNVPRSLLFAEGEIP